MSRSIAQFKFLLNKADRVSDDCWNVTTAKRKTLIVPTGFKLFDTDLKILFLGDGVTYGGIPVDGKEGGRTIKTAAADSFDPSTRLKLLPRQMMVCLLQQLMGSLLVLRLFPMAADTTYKVEGYSVYRSYSS